MIAVAGCVAQAEGAEVAGADAATWTWSSARRPITGCPP